MPARHLFHHGDLLVAPKSLRSALAELRAEATPGVLRGRLPARPGMAPGVHVGWLLLGGVGLVGAGYLIGRWWKKRKATQVSGYLMGLDVLAAPYEALAGVGR